MITKKGTLMITRGGKSNDYEGRVLYLLRGGGTLMITSGGYSNDCEGKVLS